MSTHAGTALMEMQFYPAGWSTWQASVSCAATQWCAALNIDSLSRDYFHGTNLNTSCQNLVSIEPVNFAFITKSGIPHAPPSPVNSTVATFTPNAATDLFMNSGDAIVVTLRDTASRLRIDLNDLPTGETAFTTPSAPHGFGQVQYEPSRADCKNLHYDFHPGDKTNSRRSALEADLPRIEDPAASPSNSCNRNTGSGCIKPPLTDDGVAASFYPFYSAASGYGAACAWAFGNDIPGHTVTDFGGLNQYGPLLRLRYLAFGGQGATLTRLNNFRQILDTNPCTP